MRVNNGISVYAFRQRETTLGNYSLQLALSLSTTQMMMMIILMAYSSINYNLIENILWFRHQQCHMTSFVVHLRHKRIILVFCLFN